MYNPRMWWSGHPGVNPVSNAHLSLVADFIHSSGELSSCALQHEHLCIAYKHAMHVLCTLYKYICSLTSVYVGTSYLLPDPLSTLSFFSPPSSLSLLPHSLPPSLPLQVYFWRHERIERREYETSYRSLVEKAKRGFVYQLCGVLGPRYRRHLFVALQFIYTLLSMLLSYPCYH